MPSAAILDIDGTLIDSNDAHARAWVDAFAEAGIIAPYETVRRAIGMGGDKLLPHVAGLTEDSPLGKRISERRGEIFKERYLPTVRAFPNVRALVERMVADGLTVVVATSAKKDEVDALLDIAGVRDLVSTQTSSDDADRSKPDPDIVAVALRAAGARPERAVMLGDTPYDVEAAARAGIATVALECGGWNADDLAGAAEVFATPANLLAAYERSLFGRLAAIDAAEPAVTPASMARTVAVPLLVIGAGIALTWLATRRSSSSRRSSGGAVAADPASLDAPPPAFYRPALTRRDRARLRRIIARTS